MRTDIIKFELENELDIVLAHRRAIKLAELAGMGITTQTSFATAVSEICRNAIEYADKGTISFTLLQRQQELFLEAGIADQGRGIGNLEEAMQGKPLPQYFRGNGISNAKRLVDQLEISSGIQGTSVSIQSRIPARIVVDPALVQSWLSSITGEYKTSPYEEIKARNMQLIQISEKLRESEERYRILCEAAPLMIFSADSTGTLTFANRLLLEYSGMTLEQFNREGWKNLIHPDDRERSISTWESSLKTGNSLDLEHRLRESASGTYKWHQVKAVPYTDENGSIVKWIGINIDIHDQKIMHEVQRYNSELSEVKEKLEQSKAELEKKVEELNRSNQELEQFAYVASHDLQEPLRKVTAFGDRISISLDDRLSDLERDYLHRMRSAATRMKSLIDGLLAFSKISRIGTSFRPVNLSLLVSEVLKDLEISIEQKSAGVFVDELPVIEADPEGMRHLFQNLVSNALKYSRDEVAPEIYISYRVLKPAEIPQPLNRRKEYIRITIKDNGIGFDEKYLSKIFVIFQRLHTRDIYEGTGIGLAICRKIVNHHKGSITAQSEENRGTSFFITLPVKAV